MSSIRPGTLALSTARKPRSDIVTGINANFASEAEVPLGSEQAEHNFQDEYSRSDMLTISELVHLDLIASSCSIQGCQCSYRTTAYHYHLVSMIHR